MSTVKSSATKSGRPGRPRASKRLPVLHHDATATSPSGTAGLHRRPPIRHKRHVEELLPRLQTVDPSYSKPPLRRRRIQNRGRPASMEKRVPRSLYFSCTLHHNFVHAVPLGSHGRRRRRAWLDPGFLSRRTLPHELWLAGDLSSPIPRILTRAQIPPRRLRQLPILTDYQPHPLVPPP